MYLFLLIILLLDAVEIQAKISCIGEKGKPVDMFIMYKLPRVAAWPGHRYVYSDEKDMKFRASRKRISTDSSPVAKTLEQVYSEYDEDSLNTGSQNVAHIFYNDGVPGAHGYNHSFGHTKGQVGFDKDTGFWIIQSVPNFPPRVSEGYDYPSTGYKYGQMLMCISFNSTSFHNIGSQLKYAKPHIYDSNLPSGWESNYKEIHDVIKGSFMETTPGSNTVELTSLGGTKFSHFSKNGLYGHDLYHHLVGPTLKTNLVTETWQHGKHNIGPSCKGNYTVVDIRKVSIKIKTRSYDFLTLDDHSKYALSEHSSSPYVCVGDINRQYSQYKRGGGCICVRNSELWQMFNSLVDTVDTCKKV